jgi:hypothetical protein
MFRLAVIAMDHTPLYERLLKTKPVEIKLEMQALKVYKDYQLPVIYTT